ncbi:MAG: hypothetical protein FWD55_01730 [Propionibacteriaceae bacterium]|nr:hypothetical protein [Propionibacteriaceae bacterium]
MSTESVDETTQNLKKGFGSSTWHIYVMVVVCAALIVGLVASFGGFGRRDDKYIEIEPGDTVNVGNADIRIFGLVATSPKDPAGSWRITLHTEVRNTSERPLTLTAFTDVIQIVYTNGRGERNYKYGTTMTVMDPGDPPSRSPRQVIPPVDDSFTIELSTYISDGVMIDEPIKLGLFPVYWGNSSRFGLNDVDTWTQVTNPGIVWVVCPPIELVEAEF